MSKSLYAIKEDIRSLLDNMPETEEVDDAIFDTLNKMSDEFSSKAENVALYIREQIADAARYKVESDRLSAQATLRNNKAKRLKVYLHDMMTALKTPKLEGKLVTLRIQKSPAKVVITDEDKIEDIYKVTIFSLDKPLLKAALKNGEIISGCELSQSTHLRIV